MVQVQYQSASNAPTIDTTVATLAETTKLHREVLVNGLYQSCQSYQYAVFPFDTAVARLSPTAPFRRLA
jgi:hypothetical protein